MSRTTRVLVTHQGDRVGEVGPFPVDSPWWSDVEPVVAHLRGLLGVPAVVLRLIDVAGGSAPRDGLVTYHAEALHRPDVALPSSGWAAPVWAGLDGHASGRPGGASVDGAAHSRRAAWATVDGVTAALAWAARFVAGEVGQVKTWNLSALFRIGAEPVWLKITPAFAAFEPAVFDLVRAVDPGLAPSVIAADPEHRRTLMAHVPGRDCWDAPPELIRATVGRWVAAQAALGGRPVPGGVPSRPSTDLADGLRSLLDGEVGGQLSAGERRQAARLVDALPGMVDDLDACGLPATLVHGDFHPGNWRATEGGAATVIDLADAYHGNPVFDGERLRDFVGADRTGPVVAAWCDAWRREVPGCDPVRALELARPLQALAGAVTYQMFLDHIEDSERRYHEDDPVAGVRAALSAVPGLAH